MTIPLITTVIPTYKRPRLLKRAIASVQAQTFKDIRICVHDNASGDQTEGVVRDLARQDERIHYIRNPENVGGIANMKKGIAAVKSEFFSLLSDDDFIFPDFYRQAIHQAQTHPEASTFCSKTTTIDLFNKKFERRNKLWEAGLYEPTPENIERVYHDHFVSTGVVFKTFLRDQIGMFDSSGSDRLYVTMAAAHSPFVVLDYHGGGLVLHEQSFSSTVGLRREGVDEVKRYFVEVMEQCVGMDIAVDRKAFLMSLIVKSYGASFDHFRYSAAINGEKLNDVPSYFSSEGFLAQLYLKTPLKLHPVLSSILNSRRYFSWFGSRRKDGEKHLSVLTPQALNCFSDVDCDITTIAEILQNAEARHGKATLKS
ncbi:glycosyltransferase [bacterium]|nr:glycosyltransferase [bacterium]